MFQRPYLLVVVVLDMAEMLNLSRQYELANSRSKIYDSNGPWRGNSNPEPVIHYLHSVQVLLPFESNFSAEIGLLPKK